MLERARMAATERRARECTTIYYGSAQVMLSPLTAGSVQVAGSVCDAEASSVTELCVACV